MGNSAQRRLKKETEELRAKITRQQALLQEIRPLRARQEDERNKRRELERLLQERESSEQALALSLQEEKGRQSELETRLKEAREMEKRQQEHLAKLQTELHDVRTILTNEERKKKEKEAEKRKRKQDVLDKAKASGIDYVNYFNVAIIGQAGTGKSAFYNAITGHELDDKVGLAETTMKPEFRTAILNNSSMDNIRIWDIPGSGTRRFPARTYFEDLSLFCYDFLIILVGNRLTNSDVKLFKQAIHYEINTVFVRSKSDQEVNNASEKLFKLPFSALQPDEKEEVKASVLTEIENYFEGELSKCGLATVKHFFVSAMAIIRNRPDVYPIFDEPKLFDACCDQCLRGKTKIINLDEIDIIA